jgi:hypothetical protein
MPGGRFGKMTSEKERKFLKDFYIKNGLLNKYLLDKEFLIFNQKAKDRVDIYLRLMEVFNEKNAELISLLKREQL